MACPSVDLQDYAYGFLEEEAQERVREHLAACGRCRADLARLEGEKALLSKAAAGVSAQSARRTVAMAVVPLAFAAALLAGLVWLLAPPRPREAVPATSPAQDKKAKEAKEAPLDESALNSEIGRLKQALANAVDKEERIRIQAAIDNLQIEIARLREGKSEKGAREMKEKVVKKGPSKAEELTKAIEKSPGDAALYVARAEEYLKTKKLDEGAQDARKAVELAPGNAQAHWVLGQACRLLRLNEESDRAFARAVQLDPKLSVPMDQFKKTSQVQEELNAVYGKMKATTDPDERARLEMRAKELGQDLKLLSQGDRTMVNIKEIELRLQENPNDAAALADRAAWHLDNGKAGPALKDLDRAIELKPDFALAYLKRAVAHAMKGDMDRAWKDVKRGEELDPKNMKLVEQTQGTLKKLSGAQKDQKEKLRSSGEIEQQIASLKDRLEELRAMGSNADLPASDRQRASKETVKVQSEIDRLTVELKSAPAEVEKSEKKPEKKK